MARYSEAKLGLASAKIMVVPNGIDLARARPSHRGKYRAALRERFGFAADDVLFLNAATIQPPKAQIALVLAFAQVISQHPKSRLLLAGRAVDSAYEARLRKVIRQLDLQSAVVLAGHHAEVAPFYDAADAFVLPSLWEGWSMALTEAAACGLPLIATAVGGAAELLGEVGGELVAPPFDSITDLDLSSIGRYLNRENPAFVARLADAMARVAARGGWTLSATHDLSDRFDRKRPIAPMPTCFNAWPTAAPSRTRGVWRLHLPQTRLRPLAQRSFRPASCSHSSRRDASD